jgi:hypothetical protein
VREREGDREEEGAQYSTALASLLKQILVILALVIRSAALIKHGTYNISGFRKRRLPLLKKIKENQNIYSYYIILYFLKTLDSYNLT